jgi:hypothetical protein
VRRTFETPARQFCEGTLGSSARLIRQIRASQPGKATLVRLVRCSNWTFSLHSAHGLGQPRCSVPPREVVRSVGLQPQPSCISRTATALAADSPVRPSIWDRRRGARSVAAEALWRRATRGQARNRWPTAWTLVTERVRQGGEVSDAPSDGEALPVTAVRVQGARKRGSSAR